MSNLDSLYSEFGKIASKTLLVEFSRQVDRIADQYSSNQICWDEAVSKIGALIQEFELNAKRLGVIKDDSCVDLGDFHEPSNDSVN